MGTTQNAKVLLFDLETTNLKADFGFLLCIGYKWLDQKTVYVPRIHHDRRTFRNKEKQLLKGFLAVYEEADVIVTYNGKRFDVPYLQAKALEHGFGVLPNTSHVDLYWTVKNNLAISRKSLQNAAYYLALSNEKSPVEGRIWVDAMNGSASAMKYIVDHCRADVLVLEELYLKVRGLVRTHPRVAGWGPCRSCGSDKMQSRGVYVTKNKLPRRRIRCQTCGAWEDRPEKGLIMPDGRYCWESRAEGRPKRQCQKCGLRSRDLEGHSCLGVASPRGRIKQRRKYLGAR